MDDAGKLHYKLSLLLDDTLATTASISDNINLSVLDLATTTQDSNIIFDNVSTRFQGFKETLDDSLNSVFDGSLNITNLMDRSESQIELEHQDGLSLSELALFNVNQQSEIRVLRSNSMVGNSINKMDLQQVSNRVDFITSKLKWRSIALGLVITGMSIL